MTTVEITAVSVGRPAAIGTRHGNPVLSAIGKHRVEADSITVGWLNLDGDDQADRTVHGGIDKGVYVYPAEHFAFWRHEGIPAVPGLFGENLTSTGATEEDVHLGDRFTWGDTELVVTQPRTPCYKLAMHLGRPDIITAMIATGRCGWYLRVLRTGAAPTSGPMTRVHRSDAPTVAETFAWTMRAPRDPANARTLLASPHLAAQYAQAITGLARAGRSA